jgi:hypothetical protein
VCIDDPFLLSYQINLLTALPLLMVGIAALEKAIHAKFVVEHLEIEDTSSGCGENYSVLLVSEVKQSNISTIPLSQGF